MAERFVKALAQAVNAAVNCRYGIHITLVVAIVTLAWMAAKDPMATETNKIFLVLFRRWYIQYILPVIRVMATVVRVVATGVHTVAIAVVRMVVAIRTMHRRRLMSRNRAIKARAHARAKARIDAQKEFERKVLELIQKG